MLTISDGLTLNGTVTIGDSAGTVGSTLSFVGSQTLDGSGDVVFGGGSDSNQLSIDSGSTLTIGPNVTIHGDSGAIGSDDGDTVINQGTIEADVSGGALTFSSSTILNEGTIGATDSGNVYVASPVDNKGTISAGVGSQATFNDGLDEESTGTVAIALGGTDAGQYGSLSVTGGANLSGTLDVSLVNGYSPQVNDSIPIITFDTVSGQFNTVNVPNLPPGLAATLVYGSTSVSLVFGSAQTSGGAVFRQPAAATHFSQQQLASVVAEAIRRWDAAGVAPTELSALKQLQFQVASLPNAELGMQDAMTIWIDQDAAGHGWFVGAEPETDQEFFTPTTTKNELDAPVGRPAFYKMDLLTVVEHELGHVLGLSDDSSSDESMAQSLATGIRRLVAIPAGLQTPAESSPAGNSSNELAPQLTGATEARNLALDLATKTATEDFLKISVLATASPISGSDISTVAPTPRIPIPVHADVKPSRPFYGRSLLFSFAMRKPSRRLAWVAQVVVDFTPKPPPSSRISRVLGSENGLGAMY